MNRQYIAISVLLIGFLTMSGANAMGCRTLHDFHQLTSALRAGYRVRIISDFHFCKPRSSSMSTDMLSQIIGGTSINNFIYLTKAHRIITSSAPFIRMPNGKYVYNYVRYMINDHGMVSVFASTIDPQTKESKTLGKFQCHFGRGKSQGVHFRVCA